MNKKNNASCNTRNKTTQYSSSKTKASALGTSKTFLLYLDSEHPAHPWPRLPYLENRSNLGPQHSQVRCQNQGSTQPRLGRIHHREALNRDQRSLEQLWTGSLQVPKQMQMYPWLGRPLRTLWRGCSESGIAKAFAFLQNVWRGDSPLGTKGHFYPVSLWALVWCLAKICLFREYFHGAFRYQEPITLGISTILVYW
jgi:hypothetical protein